MFDFMAYILHTILKKKKSTFSVTWYISPYHDNTLG